MTVGGSSQSDAIISRLVSEDKIPWYQKRNLRMLYLIMFPTCIGIEMTSGGVLRRIFIAKWLLIFYLLGSIHP